VDWFNDTKGYGFISDVAGTQYFVHYSDISQTGFKSLREGQRLEFIPAHGKIPGKYKATKVRLWKPEAFQTPAIA
jgi:CspA family cold shock protein